VLTYEDGGIRSRLSAGDGTFSSGPALAVPGFAPAPLGLAEFDGDGRLDVLLLHSTANGALRYLIVLRGDGAGGFGADPAAYVTVGRVLPWHVLIGDALADGRPDLVVEQASLMKLLTFANLTYPAGGPLLDLGHPLMSFVSG
jgi:hypothetical protein